MRRRQGRRGSGFNVFDRGNPARFRAWNALYWHSERSGVSSSGATVTGQIDLTGSGRDIAGVGAARPTLGSTSGGWPTVTYDGVDDVQDSVTFTAISQPFTRFAIVIPIASASQVYVDAIAVGAGRVTLVRLTNNISMNGGSAVTSGALTWTNGVAYGIVAVVNGASSSIRRDGVQVASGNVGSNTCTSLRYAQDAALGTRFNGRIVESYAFAGAMPANVISRLESRNRAIGFMAT